MKLVPEKLILESPDEISAENLKEITGEGYLGLNQFQAPFGYYDGKMRIGRIDDVHPEIKSLYPDMKGKHPIHRSKMTLPGRVWLKDKVISFWTYPKTKDELYTILKDIEKEFYSRFKKPLTIIPKNWHIEIIQSEHTEKTGYKDIGYQEWGKAKESTLIPVDQYEGSGEWSSEERGKKHVKSPIEKEKSIEKSKVPIGFGSNHPKTKSLKFKQAMFSESMNDKMFIIESLEEFLLENLGNLNKFDYIPTEWMELINRTSFTDKAAGPNSIIEEIPNDIDYKTLLNLLKKPFHSLFIVLDGKLEFMLQRESDRKFSWFTAGNTTSYGKKQKAEQNDGLNEARRGGYHGPDRYGKYGNVSIPDLIGRIKKWKEEGKEVELNLILSDQGRIKTTGERYKSRMSDQDQLKTDKHSSSWESDIPSISQKKRFQKYSTKKRVLVDKSVEKEKERLKTEILNNFDSALEKILKDLKQGYFSYGDSKSIGEAIMKGVNLDGIKKLGKAYELLKSDHWSGYDSAKASRELKKLGYL